MMWQKKLTEIGKRELIYIIVFVVLISFITSSLLAYYNHSSRGEKTNKTQNEEDRAHEADLAMLLEKGRIKYYDGNYEASISYYKQALELEPDNIKAGGNLAVVYEERGRYEKAIRVYKQLVNKTANSELKLDLAIAYFNNNQNNQAAVELKDLLENATIETEYVNRYANYYLSQIELKNSNYQLARDYINQAISYNSNFALGYRLAGDIEYQSKNYEQAIQNYHQSLRTDGSLIGVKERLGFAYLEVDNFERGVRYLKEAQNENSSLNKVNNKLDHLEDEYPEYFKEKERILPEEMEQTIPEEVNFRQISPPKEKGQQLRIGIKNEKDEIYFRVASSFKVINKLDEQILARGEQGQLSKVFVDGGNYYLEIGDEKIQFTHEIEVIPNQYVPVLLHNVVYGAGYYWGGIQDRQYRGTMEFMPRDNGITAVNLVGLEEYLLAVVPSEMSASWELEALRVQSVAARSYTLANLNRFQSRGYDLCDTVMSAAYGGITKEHPRSTKTVEQTSGEIMTYNGRPINAVYSANSGGHTEDSRDVWGYETPYLKGVSTEAATEGSSLFPLTPFELKDWLRQTPDSYSNQPNYSRASNYRWQREVSIEFLENRLGIADIEEIIPTARGAAGSVKSLLVVGANDSREFTSSLRYRFGGLRSNRFWLKPVYEAGELSAYKFYGSGWGHSVGMDQVAVLGMVDSGFEYKEILNHFYTDIKIEQVDKSN